MAEHLINAHPLLVVHITELFKCIASLSCVPGDFGKGVIIPLVKDAHGNANDLNNYRGITLIPVISKLFELVILDISQEFLVTDDLQFGFKQNSSCSHAIFTMTDTIQYFLNNGNSVFVAALDLKQLLIRSTISSS